MSSQSSRAPFLEPFFTMPSARWVPEYAITARGRSVSFETLSYCLTDLYDFGYLHLQEYNMAQFWIHQYQMGGAMPANRPFYCAWCGEEVLFLEMLDGLYELWEQGCLNERLAQENRDPNPADDDPETDWIPDFYFPFPVNIGRFGLGPTFRWLH